LLTAHVKGTVERLGLLRPETDIQEPVRHGEHKAVKYRRHDDDNDPVGYIVQLEHAANLVKMRTVR